MAITVDSSQRNDDTIRCDAEEELTRDAFNERARCSRGIFDR